MCVLLQIVLTARARISNLNRCKCTIIVCSDHSKSKRLAHKKKSKRRNRCVGFKAIWISIYLGWLRVFNSELSIPFARMSRSFIFFFFLVAAHRTVCFYFGLLLVLPFQQFRHFSSRLLFHSCQFHSSLSFINHRICVADCLFVLFVVGIGIAPDIYAYDALYCLFGNIWNPIICHWFVCAQITESTGNYGFVCTHTAGPLMSIRVIRPPFQDGPMLAIIAGIVETVYFRLSKKKDQFQKWPNVRETCTMRNYSRFS